MTTAIDVACYIESKKSLFGEMQRQKLLYYVQAWSLVWDGQPMFPDRIEAWRMGPVVPSVRHVPSSLGNVGALDDAQKATVDAILAYYGGMPGSTLGALTHKEDPWNEAWEKRVSDSMCTEEITHNAMRRYYTTVALAKGAPRRQPVERRAVDDAEILALAKANSEIWGHTLDLLAR